MTPSDILVLIIGILAAVLCVSTIVARLSRTGSYAIVRRHPRFETLMETEIADDEWTRVSSATECDQKEYPGAISTVSAGPGSTAVIYHDRAEVHGRVYPKGPVAWIDKEHFALIYKERSVHVYWTGSSVPTSVVSLPKGYALSLTFDGTHLCIYLGRPDLFTMAPGRLVILGET